MACAAPLGYAPGQTFAARRAFRGMPFVEVVFERPSHWAAFPHAISVFSPDGAVLYVNRAFREFTGFTMAAGQ